MWRPWNEDEAVHTPPVARVAPVAREAAPVVAVPPMVQQQHVEPMVQDGTDENVEPADSPPAAPLVVADPIPADLNDSFESTIVYEGDPLPADNTSTIVISDGSNQLNSDDDGGSKSYCFLKCKSPKCLIVIECH